MTARWARLVVVGIVGLAVGCGGMEPGEQVGQTEQKQVSHCTNGGCTPFAIECYEMGNVPMCLYSRNIAQPTWKQKLLCEISKKHVERFCSEPEEAEEPEESCNGKKHFRFKKHRKSQKWAKLQAKLKAKRAAFRAKACLVHEEKMKERCFYVPTTVCVEPLTAAQNFQNLPDACFGTCSDIEGCN